MLASERRSAAGGPPCRYLRTKGTEVVGLESEHDKEAELVAYGDASCRIDVRYSKGRVRKGVIMFWWDRSWRMQSCGAAAFSEYAEYAVLSGC